MFDLEDIAAFVAVANAGGFGRAGQGLGLSKSMVSRRVARLEAELGAQLLSRTTRGVAVTEAGMEFKARADQILTDLEAARDAVAQQGGEIVGSLRIAAHSRSSHSKFTENIASPKPGSRIGKEMPCLPMPYCSAA